MKTTRQKLRLLGGILGMAIILASCASFGASGARQETRCRGIIFNNTGETLTEAYIAPADTALWMPLSIESLASGESRAFSAAVNFSSRYWDIHATGASGASYTLWSVSLAASETLVIAPEDANQEESLTDDP
jgi:hypothetical protein